MKRRRDDFIVETKCGPYIVSALAYTIHTMTRYLIGAVIGAFVASVLFVTLAPFGEVTTYASDCAIKAIAQAAASAAKGEK